MSLKKRLLLFASLLALLAALASWAILQQASTGIVAQWGERLLETQLRHDMGLLSQLIEKESLRLEQLSSSASLQQWLANPQPILQDETLENYLQNIPTGAVLSIQNLSASKGYRLHLSTRTSNRNEIRWTTQAPLPVFMTAASQWHARSQTRIQLLFKSTAQPQAQLILQHSLGQQEGYLNLAIPLEQLFPEQTNAEAGLVRLISDRQGNLLLNQNLEAQSPDSELPKPSNLDELIDKIRDRQRVETLLHQVDVDANSGPDADIQIRIASISFGGRRHLIAVAHAPQTGIFELMLQDLNCLLPFERLLPLGAILLCILLGVVLLIHALMCHLLLNPLALLEKAMGRIQDGDGLDGTQLPDEYTPEVGSLARRLTSIAAKLRAAIEQSPADNRVLQRAEALERLIRIDPLTELLNRRGMSEQIEKELERARRHQYGVAILWMDVDNFKGINDTLGHLQGDQALQAVSNILRQCLRSYDHAARWGGDEFLVLLSPCTEEALQTIGERIRQQIAQSSTCQCPLTVSIGAYMASGKNLEQTQEQLLDRADHALYHAKQAGRNCLKLYSDNSQSS